MRPIDLRSADIDCSVKKPAPARYWKTYTVSAASADSSCSNISAAYRVCRGPGLKILQRLKASAGRWPPKYTLHYAAKTAIDRPLYASHANNSQCFDFHQNHTDSRIVPGLLAAILLGETGDRLDFRFRRHY